MKDKTFKIVLGIALSTVWILGSIWGYLLHAYMSAWMVWNMNMRNKCCRNPEGGIVPVGKDGYICRRCSEETHEEIKVQLEISAKHSEANKWKFGLNLIWEKGYLKNL